MSQCYHVVVVSVPMETVARAGSRLCHSVLLRNVRRWGIRVQGCATGKWVKEMVRYGKISGNLCSDEQQE